MDALNEDHISIALNVAARHCPGKTRTREHGLDPSWMMTPTKSHSGKLVIYDVPPREHTPYRGSTCYEAFAAILPKSIAFGSTNSPLT